MAGEVRSELKITLAGSIAGAGSPGVTGSSFRPVARQADFDLGQLQSMRDFARRARHGKDLAEVISRDRSAVREIEEAILRRSATAELDLSSSRRANEQARMAAHHRRQLFHDRVRANAFGMADDPFDRGTVGRRAIRSASAASKRLIKGWGTGVASGLAPQFAFPDDGGAFGAVTRVGLATVSGAAWGGAPGAVGAAITSTISEIIRAAGQTNMEIEILRREFATTKAEFRRAAEESFRQQKEFNENLKQEFDHEMLKIVDGETLNRYREERFVESGLVD